jgi:hypothetical protein
MRECIARTHVITSEKVDCTNLKVTKKS